MPVETSNLDATLVSLEGQSWPVQIKDLSHGGVGVTAPVNQTGLKQAILQVKVPAWNRRQVALPVRLRWHRRLGKLWQLGLQFDPETLADKRAIIALVYGDSDLHEANQRRRQIRIRLRDGLRFLIGKANCHALENFAFLTNHYSRRMSIQALRKHVAALRRPLDQLFSKT